MPAALIIANTGAGIEPKEERKGGPAVSHTAAIEPTGGSSFSDFSPLQDLNAAVALHDPFAHMKVSEEAESSNQAPQMGQANCLRFSPTLSSDHVVITDNGKCASVSRSVSHHTLIKFNQILQRRALSSIYWTLCIFLFRAQIKLVNTI